MCAGWGWLVQEGAEGQGPFTAVDAFEAGCCVCWNVFKCAEGWKLYGENASGTSLASPLPGSQESTCDVFLRYRLTQKSKGCFQTVTAL